MNENPEDGSHEVSEYDGVTDREWVEYEFATVEHDYRIHPDAAKAIRAMFDRLDSEGV